MEYVRDTRFRDDPMKNLPDTIHIEAFYTPFFWIIHPPDRQIRC